MRARLLSVLILLILVGCDAQIDQFQPNQVHSLALAKSRSTPMEAASDDVTVIVEKLFGKPDSPVWPASIAELMPASLVDPERLERAAGAVSSEKDGTHRGLFREHCVVCHGLQGGGAGPAGAIQNPYPRDFRFGIFKWKSTERAAKPSRSDLHQLLTRGVPGTAMPSFSLIAGDDVDALIDYVIYLSVRGEVERKLLSAALELDYGADRPQLDWQLSLDPGTEGGEVVGEVLTKVAASWHATETIPVPPWTSLDGSQHAESVQRGQAIFHGQIANCVGCHGPAGNGSTVTLDYDDWTKDFSTRIGLTPTDREAMRPFREAGALRPRQIHPRDLQLGVFRGGGEPETLFRRISQGIAGTPMPAVEVVPQENGKGLTTEQMWDLIRYVKSLGTLNQEAGMPRRNQREGDD